MAKAAKAKAKRSHKPKTTDKAQSERFIQAARELNVATSADALSAFFDKVTQPKKPQK